MKGVESRFTLKEGDVTSHSDIIGKLPAGTRASGRGLLRVDSNEPLA